MDELRKKLKDYSPYLEDFFRRIYLVTIFFIIFFTAGFLLSTSIIRLFTKIFNFNEVVLTSTSPFQLIDLAMNIGLSFAVLFSTPIFLYHLYAFIGGGLRKAERKTFFFLIPIGTLLFLIGFSYSFYILYLTMQTFADINTSLGLKNLWSINIFLSQIISTSVLLGIIFEFPIVMTFLIRAKIFSIDFLKRKRRHAILALFIFTSLLPPTDGISLLVMVLPLIVMYEITIVYNRLTSRQLI